MLSKHGFWIDKITNSIEERKTGKNFDTNVLSITPEQIKLVLKKDGWLFNWKKAYSVKSHQLFKLVVTGNARIEGLISLEVRIILLSCT